MTYSQTQQQNSTTAVNRTKSVLISRHLLLLLDCHRLCNHVVGEMQYLSKAVFQQLLPCPVFMIT